MINISLGQTHFVKKGKLPWVLKRVLNEGKASTNNNTESLISITLLNQSKAFSIVLQ